MPLILSGLSVFSWSGLGFWLRFGVGFLGDPLGISIHSIHGNRWDSEERCPYAAEDQAPSFTLAAAAGDRV